MEVVWKGHSWIWGWAVINSFDSSSWIFYGWWCALNPSIAAAGYFGMIGVVLFIDQFALVIAVSIWKNINRRYSESLVINHIYIMWYVFTLHPEVCTIRLTPFWSICNVWILNLLKQWLQWLLLLKLTFVKTRWSVKAAIPSHFVSWLIKKRLKPSSIAFDLKRMMVSIRGSPDWRKLSNIRQWISI